MTSRLALALAVAGLVGLAAPARADTILPPGSTWEYTFVDPTGDPTWNTTTGAWATGPAPFGNFIGGTDFDYATLWPADGSGSLADDLWVRVAVDLTGYDLSTVTWDLGADNGYKLYANGTLVSSDNAEGFTFRWEYSGAFGGALVPGVNVIAVALEDHGGLTAFDMQICGTAVPEPATMTLLGVAGLAGLAYRRRR